MSVVPLNIPGTSRESSRDAPESRMVRHQHSFSESGRSSVPMWDSADPERAPPPLPINPGATGSPITRPNTSARIEEAAALITARARENAPSSYTSNPPPSPSPDKSIMKPQHRRMHNIQSNPVGRLSDSLERRSPDKGLRASKLSEYEEYRSTRASERSPTRSGSGTTTPTPKPSQLENTPPPSNMLALQAVRTRLEPQPPLTNISNGISANPPVSLSFDALSTQILSLTTIATNLQREMSNLTKRSKDNASDLLVLKDATNARDEDIRKSLKDLVTGLDVKFSTLDSRLVSTTDNARGTPNLGFYLDDKGHTGSPGRYALPRIGSPANFAASFDRDITASPSLAFADGAASIALLEKVLREMATRDGQEKIMILLENAKAQAQSHSSVTNPERPPVDPKMMAKLESVLEMLKDLKEDTENRALVKVNNTDSTRAVSQIDLFLDHDAKNGQLSKGRRNSEVPASATTGTTSSVINDEIVKTLKSVKQSLAQGGGLTNEVKVLVRDLRGEVLGMGREIARKLEQADMNRAASQHDNQEHKHEEMVGIVQQGLAELKENFHYMIQESTKLQAALMPVQLQATDVNHIVRSALAELPQPRNDPPRDAVAEREELLAAVREAWEDCKPEIALEHFGLERDEILETLKEGLKSFQPQQPIARDEAITYEDVLDAVQKGLANFQPPPIPIETGVTREELLAAVRECLENFDFPMSMPPTLAPTERSDLNRNEVLDAVREGLSYQQPMSKEVEFNREDLFDAIRSCLEGEQNPLGGMGERVVEAMHEFLSSMKTEFQQYSAANGKDTEQVLDALKDGLEDLRADIESYVDRASDVTGKDEIVDVVKAGFAAMQSDIEKGFAAHEARGAPNTPELLDAMEKEFEHLRDTMNKSLARGANGGDTSDKAEILDAIRDLSDDRSSYLSSNSEDIVRLVKEELEHMRTTLAVTLVKSGSALNRDDVVDAVREGLESSRSHQRNDGNESILSNTSELLDAFQDGVDGIRSDLKNITDRVVDVGNTEEILDTLRTGIDSIRTDIEQLNTRSSDRSDAGMLRGNEMVVRDENLISTEIEGLKVMITQLRIKVEALDGAFIPPTAPTESRMHKDDLDGIHGAIRQLHESVENVRSTPIPIPEVVMPANAASKDDIDAVETLLRNVKAKVDDFTSDEKRDQLKVIETMLVNLKSLVEESSTSAREVAKEDYTVFGLLLKDVQSGVEEMQNKFKDISGDDSLLSKNEIAVLESLCLDIKSQMETAGIADANNTVKVEDISEIKDSIKAFREQFEADNELTAQAFEARKVEHGGIATKIDDVKGMMTEFRTEILDKLDGSGEGIVELNKVLGMHHEDMSTYATAASVAELSELMKEELARHMEHHTTSKVEMEERDATLFTKHEETSNDVKLAIEEKFTELMTKYDDAQLASSAKLEAMDQRDKSSTEALSDTKAVVEEVKTLVDTLGTTVSETCERISGDSSTVYARCDEAVTKIGDLHSANAYEHGVTREQIATTLAATARVEGSLTEHHPTVLAAIREILGIVGQHYQHSQEQTENLTRATEEIKSGVSAIPSTIHPLLPAPPTAASDIEREVQAVQSYDDSHLQNKLDDLITQGTLAQEAFDRIESHNENIKDPLSNLGKLNDMHVSMMEMAGEISNMVATQSRLMADQHETRAQEAAEAAIALEKRNAQKEKVESDILSLNEEKNVLIASMVALRREQDELSIQTKKLTREVAKLETALTIRQEEMRDMNARAEGLERRVLEGLMNHARSVKAAKVFKTPKITPAQRDAAMSLKRVPSNASTVTAKTSVKDANSTIGNTLGLALKKRTPLGSGANPATNSRASNVDRRILSTGHVTGKRGIDTVDRGLILAPAPSTGLVGLKRSHSVKSNTASYLNGRKPSWNGIDNTAIDKENQHNQDNLGDDDDDNSSDGGSERRTSYTGSYSDSLTYGSNLSARSRRSVSYASSIGGAIDGQVDGIVEDDEDTPKDESRMMVTLFDPTSRVGRASRRQSAMPMSTLDEEEDVYVEAVGQGSELQPPPLFTDLGLKYHEPSDSGLGTDASTAEYERQPGSHTTSEISTSVVRI